MKLNFFTKKKCKVYGITSRSIQKNYGREVKTKFDKLDSELKEIQEMNNDKDDTYKEFFEVFNDNVNQLNKDIQYFHAAVKLFSIDNNK